MEHDGHEEALLRASPPAEVGRASGASSSLSSSPSAPTCTEGFGFHLRASLHVVNGGTENQRGARGQEAESDGQLTTEEDTDHASCFR